METWTRAAHEAQGLGLPTWAPAPGADAVTRPPALEGSVVPDAPGVAVGDPLGRAVQLPVLGRGFSIGCWVTLAITGTITVMSESSAQSGKRQNRLFSAYSPDPELREQGGAWVPVRLPPAQRCMDEPVADAAGSGSAPSTSIPQQSCPCPTPSGAGNHTTLCSSV